MMKKLFFTLAVAALAVVAANAQPRAIGGNIGYGFDVSYQHNLGEANMIDLAVNLPAFAGIGATCTYDWINPFNTKIPWDNKGEWNWALGVGAGAGYWWTYESGAGYAGVVGHCGVAYDFWFPLELSVDYRPNIGARFGGGEAGFYSEGLYVGVQIGVRYLFNQK